MTAEVTVVIIHSPLHSAHQNDSLSVTSPTRGPPLKSLYDLDRSHFSTTATTTTTREMGLTQQKGQQIDEDDDVMGWVTVFGFSRDSADFILEKFSQYGEIVRHEVCCIEFLCIYNCIYVL